MKFSALKHLLLGFIPIYILFYYLWVNLNQSSHLVRLWGADIFSLLGALVGALCLFYAYRKPTGQERIFWLLLFLGTINFLIGELVWNYYELYLGVEIPFPGWPDIFYLIHPFFCLLAILYKMYQEKDSYQSIRLLFDILIIMVIAATFSWYYLISPLLQRPPVSPLFIFTSIAYPIVDLGLLFGLLSMYLDNNKIFSPLVLSFLTGGFILLIFADSTYLYLSSQNLYLSGGNLDPLWTLGLLLIGAAGLYAEPYQLDSNPDTIKIKEYSLEEINYLRLFLPYFSLVTLFIVVFWQLPQVNSITIGLGTAILLVVIRQIITLLDNHRLLRVLHSSMEDLTYHDTLTGLPNRRLFAENLQQAIAAAEQHQQLLAVLVLDLDRFKNTNDNWGHAFGDRLLKKVAIHMMGYLSKNDIVSRLGGDEFVILLRNVPSLQEVVKATRDILELVAQPVSLEGKVVRSSCSIGIAVYPYDGNDAEALIKYADMAMYQAKELGKNNYQFFTSDLDSLITRKLLIENNLWEALKNQELSVYYQAQVNLKTGKIVGMEALVRWQSPQLGVVSPGEFIPIAEETGIILEIGEWTLRTACLQTKAWEKAGYPPLRLGVNLSLRQFQRKNLVETIASVLKETQIRPQQLDLEITESMAMHHVETVINRLEDLKRLGVHLSMDDFGTGYSSLSYLSKMPIDTLKIAQLFISQITTNHDDNPIVQTIIAMAKSLNLQILAEGVETSEQAQYLTQLDCDEAQGYLFSQPLSALEFEELLKQASFPHTIAKNEYTN